MSIFIAADKKRDLLSLLSAALATGHLTRAKAQSLVGKLAFNLMATPPARTYLVKLYKAIHVSGSHDETVIWLGKALVADLNALVGIVSANKGRAAFKAEPVLAIFSDAALTVGPPTTSHAGFYAVSAEAGCPIFFSHFALPDWAFAGSTDQSSLLDEGDATLEDDVPAVTSSTLAEAWGVWVALDTLVHGRPAGLTGLSVLLVCDNICLIYALEKGRSKAKDVNDVIRNILILCARNDILFMPSIFRERRGKSTPLLTS